MRKTLFLMGLLAWSLGSVAMAEDRRTLEPDDSPEAEEMNKLAEQGLEKSVRVISRSGSLYPFGLVLRENGKTATSGYSGDPEKAPPAMEWAQAMIWQLRKTARDDDSIKAIAVFRLHHAKTEEGDNLPGIWALVDHRDHRPWTLFLPLVKNENGKHSPGELVYYPTPDDQKIFLRGEEGESGS